MKTGKSKDHLQRVFLRFLYLIMGSILSLDSVMAQETSAARGVAAVVRDAVGF
jgi:ABC-type transport system involved in Fe-S cluster assembly fused permease/ATPase subunit